MKTQLKYLIYTLAIALASCSETKTEETETPAVPKLPIYGERYFDEDKKDTVYHQIPDFELLNQDSVLITQKDLEGKIIIADFFFTSCPTMCPVMTSELKRVAKVIEKMNEVYIVSHTVDPEIDTLATLRAYAKDNAIDTKKWWFLWGPEEFIHNHGGEGYMLAAQRDSAAPGGFLHASQFVLIDKEKRIRGIYDGLQKNEVEQLLKDLEILRKEYEQDHTAAN
ncbi:MAG TPA: SCO family protein [Flavobacteriales bacterium]|nr:SCO family protein [Flavobacteriales bacterium]